LGGLIIELGADENSLCLSECLDCVVFDFREILPKNCGFSLDFKLYREFLPENRLKSTVMS
jgi:hypothetical protein